MELEVGDVGAWGMEDWIRDNPRSPDLHEVLRRTDAHMRLRLHGRDVLGFAYLTLLRV